MIQETLRDISTLLENHNVFLSGLTVALQGDDMKMWEYLISNGLWGGAGSVADQELLEFPDARKQLESLLIRLGQEQMSLGRMNVRTEMWVSVFEKSKTEDAE